MNHKNGKEDKTCRVCGRRMQWRKKWAHDFHRVKHCSAACRRHGVGPEDLALEEVMMTLLRRRDSGASICPSDAARQIRPDADEWRNLMEPARMAARRLVARGLVEITQGGREVDPSSAKGPIRICLTAASINHPTSPSKK